MRVCILHIGVGYEDDLDRALEVMRDVMMNDSRALSDPPGWFGVQQLGDFAVTVEGRVWISTEDHRVYKADMTKLMKETYDREGIEMPYPHAVEMSKGEVPRRDPPIKPALPAARNG